MHAELLQEKLAAFQPLPLAVYPTPLEHLSHLSQALGRDVFIKRDDIIGPGLGGNKTRKLEYLLADALRKKAHKVVTFGGLQSNHARLTAAAARKVGLEPHLFYFTPRPAQLAGNLLVDQLLGAKLHFIPLADGGGSGMSLEATIRLVHLVAWAMLGSHFFIPVGGHNWLGGLGYVQAALELDSQMQEMGLKNAHLVVAAGSGGTLAGLLAGFRLLHSSIQPLGIDVGNLWKGFPFSIARLAAGCCARLGELQTFSPAEVPLIEGRYVGAGYACSSPACLLAIQRLASLEGILLDPVYTAKAFAGLLDLVESGALGRTEPVIFLHTGGYPALFCDCYIP